MVGLNVALKAYRNVVELPPKSARFLCFCTWSMPLYLMLKEWLRFSLWKNPRHSASLGRRTRISSSTGESRLERGGVVELFGTCIAMPLKLVAEYAKSGRGTCKHCGAAVSKGNLRVGSVSKGPGGHLVTQWHHVNCVRKAKLLLDATKAESIGGFRLLKAVDQNVLRDVLVAPVEAPIESSQGEEALYDEGKWEATLTSFNRLKLTKMYKGACLPKGWKAFATVIVGEPDGVLASKKIAAFDFDGCLVNTSIRRHGAEAWSLLYASVPEKLESYHKDGFKLVVFTNESNIDGWVNNRQKAIDSKIGRLEGLRRLVNAPILVFISCGLARNSDPCRKPAPGMWHLMEQQFNEGLIIDRESSFYVGDAAGRPRDHSDADSGFAKAAGLRFFLPEDIFVMPPAPKASLPTIKASEMHMKSIEIVHDIVHQKPNFVAESSVKATVECCSGSVQLTSIGDV